MNLHSPISPAALYALTIPFTIVATYATAALLPLIQPTVLQNNPPTIATPATITQAPLTNVVWTNLYPNNTVYTDGLRVTLRTQPDTLITKTPTRFMWEIVDAQTGQPAALETGMHRTTMHSYAVRNDLRGELIHIHPISQKEDGVWTDQIVPRTTGEWKLLMQTVYRGKVYNFLTSFAVSGEPEELEPVDLNRTKKLGEWTVHLKTSPETPRANAAARFDFFVDPKPTGTPFQITGNDDGGHNIIFSRANDPYLWNIHGDRSVENLPPDETGIVAQRLLNGAAPYSYNFTFPKPGTWLIHFEIQSQPAHFFLEVNR